MTRKLKDLCGMRFGKLIVQKEVERRNGYRHWLWQCGCGSTIEVYHGNLTNGHTNSCGCISLGRPRKN